MVLIEELFLPLVWMLFGGVALYFLLIPVIYIKDLMTSTYLPNYTLFFHLYPVIYLYLPLIATVGYGTVLIRISYVQNIGCVLFASLVGLSLLLRLFLAEYEEVLQSVVNVIFILPPILFFFSFLPLLMKGESTTYLLNSLALLLPNSVTCVILVVPVAMAIDYFRFRKLAGF